ncbi:MAG TPA: site-2 protease family protein [Opitutaceae bacterium]|nr:site-2 protease family protein [Opitutaceae bacterium]
MTTALVVLALLWPALFVIRALFVWRLLVGMEFRRPAATPIEPADLPAHLREGAHPWIAQLEALGFRVVGGWRIDWAADAALADESIVMAHPSKPVRAIVEPHGQSSRSGECWLALRTTTAQGFEIVTSSHAPEQLLRPPPGYEFESLATNSAAELLQRHLARVGTEIAAAWSGTDIGSIALREQYVRDAILMHAHAAGDLADRGRGGFSYRAARAFGAARRILRDAAAQKKQRGKNVVPRRTELSLESQLTFDLQHYRQQAALLRGRFSLRTKAAITAVSFVVFAAALAWRMSPTIAIALIVALVVHEAGHLLGMKLFGYRDTQLLFVPFFGGAAVGHDDKVLRPWQHIVIVLLGPLPGIFLGLALFAWQAGGDGPAWVRPAAITAILLNVFNLLPIMPLDGGQILDYAVASRFPRARVFFLGASAAALVLLGLAPGTGFVLGLGVVMLLRLRVEWRLAALWKDVRAEFLDGGDEETIVRRLLESLREPEWKKTSMSRRLQLARGLQRVIRIPAPGIGTMVFAAATFSAPLWLGLPVAVVATVRRNDALVRQAEAKAAAAGLIAAAAPEQAGVRLEDNAALLYAKAEALSDERANAPATKDRDAEIVTLLRTAAHKPAFVPLAAGREERPAARLIWWPHGSVVQRLTVAAQERLRFQEPVEAAALAVDALRLVRLMDTAPGWLSWEMHRSVEEGSWAVVEEVLAGGTTLPAKIVADLRTLSDERAEIAFAAAALPVACSA